MRTRNRRMTRALRRAKPGNESMRAFARRVGQTLVPDSEVSPAADRARFLTSAASLWIGRKGFAA
jgi:hypothetical protein